jgi:hypothetical protein
MGVTWEDYDRFSRAVREGENCRVAFDGKDIELMVLGPFHESLRGIIDAFIAIVARELGVEHQAVGSTTWKRKTVKRGIESDVSYYFDAAKRVAFAAAFARRSNKVKALQPFSPVFISEKRPDEYRQYVLKYADEIPALPQWDSHPGRPSRSQR